MDEFKYNMSEIPLFPLPLVLFPGGRLPLKIFETRYLDMIKRCMRDNAGFGIVMIEAMLAKVPVLASDAPGPSEVLGDTGKQFRDGDPDALAGVMQELVAFTPEARSQLAAAGHERVVTKFSPERFHSRFWSLPPVAEVANG